MLLKVRLSLNFYCLFLAKVKISEMQKPFILYIEHAVLKVLYYSFVISGCQF
jgi:hypothetical protein